MKKILFIVFLFFFICPLLRAQDEQFVVINEDYQVLQVMQRYAELNRGIKNMDGWRIQISSMTDRRALDEAIAAFNVKYPMIPVDWTHAKPYYKLKVGAFNTRAESLQLLSQLKQEYPNAYPIQENNLKIIELVGLK